MRTSSASHNASHKIARQIENLLRRAAVETFAKNGSHRPGKSLHFRAERHPDMRFALFIHLQINSHRVGAFFVLTDILELEFLACHAAPVSPRCPRRRRAFRAVRLPATIRRD